MSGDVEVEETVRGEAVESSKCDPEEGRGDRMEIQAEMCEGMM